MAVQELGRRRSWLSALLAQAGAPPRYLAMVETELQRHPGEDRDAVSEFLAESAGELVGAPASIVCDALDALLPTVPDPGFVRWEALWSYSASALLRLAPHRYHEPMDQHLQQLRRAWQASGSTADEAAYLLERVRVGDLTTEHLELAAYCGHAGAVEALGSKVPVVPADISKRYLKVARWGAIPTLALALLACDEFVQTNPLEPHEAKFYAALKDYLGSQGSSSGEEVERCYCDSNGKRSSPIADALGCAMAGRENAAVAAKIALYGAQNLTGSSSVAWPGDSLANWALTPQRLPEPTP